MSKDLKDYSKDAFFHIPPASASDFTGYAPYLPDDEEAQNLSKLMDVPATGADNPNETIRRTRGDIGLDKC